MDASASIAWLREQHARLRAAALEAEANDVDCERLLELQTRASLAERDLQRALESAAS